MMPGKIIHRLLPQVTTGSHCSVNKLAYGALPRLVRKRHFPNWHQINNYEGLNGLDGLWLKHQHLPSQTAFNLDTEEGHGIEEAWEQYERLVQAWREKNNEDVAKQLAYTSHVITDISTPTHQHGKMTAPKITNWYGLITRDDWQEETTGSNHVLFELRLMYHLTFRALGKISINARAIKHIVTAKKRPQALQNVLRKELGKIRKRDIYRMYVQQGWSQKIEETMANIIMPTIASSVATVWLSSWLVSRPNPIKQLMRFTKRSARKLNRRQFA